MKLPYIIGITGSIGTGKSTLAQAFRLAGVPIHDSDQCVHALLGVGGAAVNQVAVVFPEAKEENQINRAKLASLVFGQNDKLKNLEDILHPHVRVRRQKFIAEAQENLIGLDIPLLFETGTNQDCNIVFSTFVSDEIQRQRVLLRSGMTEEKFNKINIQQISQQEKIKRCDIAVEMIHGEEILNQNVKKFIYQFQQRLEFSKKGTPHKNIEKKEIIALWNI